MKRVISIALVVLMTAALLVACGSSSGPEGKYVLKSFNGKSVDERIKSEAESVGMTADELLKQLGIDNGENLIVLELKADGTLYMKEAMFGTESTGTWKQDGSKIVMTVDGQDSTFALSGNELTYSEDDAEYVLIKK